MGKQKIIDKLIAELESYIPHISEDKKDEYLDCVETLALALGSNDCENRNACPTRPVVIKAN